MQMRNIYTLLLLSLSIPLLASPQVPEDEEDVYLILTGEADKAIDEGDYLTAIDRLQEAIAINPGHPSNVLLLSNLGTMYSYLDSDTLALEAFDRALTIAPSMTVIKEKRAKLYLKMGQASEAFSEFCQLIDRDSCNVTARYYRGIMSLYGGDRFGAEADFEVLKDIAPDDLNTKIALSTLYSMTGRDKEAIPYYKQLIEEEPLCEFYAALAGCYLAEAMYSEAAETINDGMTLYPADPELYYYRAWLHRDTYRLKEAHADAERAVSLGLSPGRAAQLFDR